MTYLEKVLIFTKNYCLPKLINSEQLIQIIGTSKANKGPSDGGTRDLIPYVCLYNGINIINAIKSNPEIKIE